MEYVEYSGSTFVVWDMGGQDRTRILWRCVSSSCVYSWLCYEPQHRTSITNIGRYYYEGVAAVIFVVDSTDRIRMREARDELQGTVHSLAVVTYCIW